MTPAAQALIAAIDEQVRLYTQIASLAGDAIEFDYQPEDMAQIVDGFYQVMREYIAGGILEKWGLFFETAVPTLADHAKGGVIDLVKATTFFIVRITPELVSATPPGLRQE